MAFLNKTGLERLWAHVISQLGHKVEKVDGKGLSTNDFTNEEKEKLANLSTEGLASEEYVDNAVSVGVANLVNSAPETLDTLGEIATALEENADVVDALNSAISNKVDKVEGMGLMPEADGAWKYLVTDDEGNKKWDERLAWQEGNKTTFVENYELNFLRSDRKAIPLSEFGITAEDIANQTLTMTLANRENGSIMQEATATLDAAGEGIFVNSAGETIAECYSEIINFIYYDEKVLYANFTLVAGSETIHPIDPKFITGAELVDEDNGKLLGVQNGEYTLVANNSVLYTEQELTEDQQSQARTNIGVEYATDEEVLAAMIEADIIPAIETENGALLSSAENTILII